jgi:hypothetical protein
VERATRERWARGERRPMIVDIDDDEPSSDASVNVRPRRHTDEK